MNIQRHNYENLGLPLGPYVHSVTHQSTLYTSGLTAFGTPAESGTISDQAKVIFDQLESIALQQNTSLQHLIKVTIFVTDLTDIDKLRDFLFESYGENLPASALIKIDSLFIPDLLIEIEAIFAL